MRKFTMVLLVFVSVMMFGCAGKLVNSNIVKMDQEVAKGQFLDKYLNTILKQDAYNRFINQSEFVEVNVLPKKEYGATYDFIFKNNGNYNFNKDDLNIDFVSKNSLFTNKTEKYIIFRITTGVTATEWRRAENQPTGSIYMIKGKYVLVTYGVEYSILTSETTDGTYSPLYIHTNLGHWLRGGWLGFQSADLSKVENYTSILVSTFPEILLTKTSYDPMSLVIFDIR